MPVCCVLVDIDGWNSTDIGQDRDEGVAYAGDLMIFVSEMFPSAISENIKGTLGKMSVLRLRRPG